MNEHGPQAEPHDEEASSSYQYDYASGTFPVMTHKYRGCIVVLSINKSVEPNEEQKVLAGDLDKSSL